MSRARGPLPSSFLEDFRVTAPYIHSHRGRIFVIAFAGEVVAERGFEELIHDVSLLHALGIRLVLVHGARMQVDRRLAEQGVKSRVIEGLRVTDRQSIRLVAEAMGAVRARVEARLSMSVAGTPMAGAKLRVSSGNFVVAKPVGVRGGVDYLFTGEVRRVDAEAVRARLDDGNLVLISPLGYSPTGELFNLSSQEVAAEVAVAIGADKVIALVEGRGVLDGRRRLISSLTPSDAEALLARGAQRLSLDTVRHLHAAIRAVRGGVRRVHLVDRRVDGALLQELFTREGVGTMLTAERLEDLRPARFEDMAALRALLRPLEEAGTLIRRSRERLAMEVDRFVVLERDGVIVGCAALEIFEEGPMAEIYCVAIHPSYRGGGRGAVLIEHLVEQARRRGAQRVFVLTTQTSDWFKELGFLPRRASDLPRSRGYDKQRRSKVLMKELTEEEG